MRIRILLIIVIAIAFFLRFFSLSVNPPALTWDEAAWGYNAYTLSLTGKDEFGRFLPITYLESFGDFKPPMYAYLSVIPIKLFGLNEFSIRFASAFLGSITVLLTFFLVIQLFPQIKGKNFLGLLCAFILAISPWHILLSRAAFEANVASFFIILGTLLFLISTGKRLRPWVFLVSMLSFVAACYTFNTSRVFLPLFVSSLFICRWKIFFNNWKKALIAVIPAVIVFIPLAIFLTTPQAKLRYEEVNIFSDISVIERTNQEIKNDNNVLYSKILHNRRFAYAVEYIRHYFDNFDPAFLFIKGDGNPKFSIQDVGQMYLWELPFIVIGSFLLFRKKEGNWVVVPLWLLLGIVPAATARETPHALRIETILPMPQLITAYGIFYAYFYISKIKRKILSIKIFYVLCGIFITCVLLNFIYFFHTYFFHYPIKYASEWQYGYKEAVKYAEENKNKYKNIYMTNALGRPYIYVLLFGKYKPGTLENANITREALGFVHVDGFNKYTFYNDLPFDDKNTLYINSFDKVPGSAQILKEFKMPNGQISLVAYDK